MWSHPAALRKSKCVDCKFAPSPLGSNHTTAWKWIVLPRKLFLFFADETVPDTLRGYRLASQLHLADGLDFKGGDTEKIVYADLMMLTWIAGPEVFGRSWHQVFGTQRPGRCISETASSHSAEFTAAS